MAASFITDNMLYRVTFNPANGDCHIEVWDVDTNEGPSYLLDRMEFPVAVLQWLRDEISDNLLHEWEQELLRQSEQPMPKLRRLMDNGKDVFVSDAE